jgi:formylglycine-generating enzyme required for sulfatase activity
MESNPSNFKKGDNYPVENLSWNYAKEYIRKLNGMGSGKFRLPSEAEWEYAARSGGKAEKYSGGSDLNSVAWYDGNSGGGTTHPVKTKKSNGLGIYDMSGNVSEWCEDVYIADVYSRSDRNNPIYTTGEPNQVVIRGGSWNSGPADVRCALRHGFDPSSRSFNVGFRLLRMP